MDGEKGFIHLTVIRNDVETALQSNLKQLCNDEQTRYGINAILKNAINEYVPMDTGRLRLSARADSETVSWRTPYAHYQFMGVVYGPNFLVKDRRGYILGWRSPRGVGSKSPTGRSLGWYYGYTTEGTTSDWVNAMWSDSSSRRRTNLLITNYLKRRVKEMNL